MPEDANIEHDDRSRIKRSASVELVRAESEDEDKPKRIRVTAATETPVRVWGVDEVLSMAKNAVDLSRLRNDAPFLADHTNEIDSILGRIEKASIEDRKLMVDVVLADTQRARDYAALLDQGLATKVSIGYTVSKWDQTREGGDGEVPEFTAKRWQPMEVSAVAVPADDSAVVSRTRKVTHIGVGGNDMPDETRNETEAEVQTDAPAAPVETRAEQEVTVTNNAASVLAMGKAFENRGVEGSLELAHQAIDGNHDTDWLNARILKLMDERAEKAKAEGEKRVEDMKFLSDAENRKFSIVALFRHLWQPGNRGFRADAGMEIEACEEARKRNQNVEGYSGTGDLSLPMDYYYQPVARTKAERQYLEDKVRTRALSVGVGGSTANEANELVATVLDAGRFIDLLRNRSVLLGRVMELPGLVGNLDIPKQTGAATVSWVEEAPAAPTGLTDPSFDVVSLTPKKLFVGTAISHSALLQTTPAVEMLVRMDHARSKALKVDDAGLNGAKADAKVPTGILNADGINKANGGTDTNGLDATLQRIALPFQEVDADNALMDDSMVVVNTRLKWRLKVLEMAANTGIFVWRDNMVLDYPAVASNQIPSANRGNGGQASSFVVFSPMDVLFGSWGTDDVLYDPYTQRRQGQVVMSTFAHHDFALRYPESVGVLEHVKSTIPTA